MIALFSFTLFLSAFLLFCIEPIVAKMLLPVAGGAPAVWSTCLAFFQVTLLLGYVFTHLTLSRLPPRRHAALYGLLFPLALLTMPIALHGAIGSRLSPALGVLLLLTEAVGAPFFVLCTLAPAVQRWFASTRSPHAKDPYFLYAASNAGSVGALLLYPFVIEPYIDLRVQARALEVAFVLLGVLLLACALVSGRDDTADAAAAAPRASFEWSRRARWVLLAAVPSAQLVALTTYLTTEVAPAPLLWTVPLAVYLVTFVLAFARRALIAPAQLVKRLPFVAAVGLLLVIVGANEPAPLVIGLHVGALFVVAMVCHGTIAADRPDVARLPEYFAWMSLGGALGGSAAALLAPLVFKRPIEYPLCFLLALACLPAVRPARWAYVVSGVAVALAVVGASIGPLPRLHVNEAALVGVPLIVALAIDRFPRLMMWTLAALLFVKSTFQDARDHVVHRERSFFGAFSVTRNADETSLMHGNTMHGLQLAHDPHTPTLYFTQHGPAGDVIAVAQAAHPLHRVGIIGLGTGSLATYARPGEHWRFFELDPAVVQIARDARYFTFLADAFPGGADVVVGDARIEIVNDEGGFDLFMVDAFTSDSIPTHLLTREAFATYRTKLAPGAILAWHVSNRHLDLDPELAALADDAGWFVLARDVLRVTSPEEERAHAQPTRWVAMAEEAATLGPLRAKGWTDVPRRPGFRCWTDERASIVTVWK